MVAHPSVSHVDSCPRVRGPPEALGSSHIMRACDSIVHQEPIAHLQGRRFHHILGKLCSYAEVPAGGGVPRRKGATDQGDDTETPFAIWASSGEMLPALVGKEQDDGLKLPQNFLPRSETLPSA
ncbi:hypothetical protein LMH87_003632 [Akanthomyces muscarius]|uniref:Uncharacterized protein n=1 Tax=Akanthomyces muscarius TaxID=2231603 RepID=A0A9W8Q3P1_AKAMU|nr:hypothetical protein LMH87_003632 [Akanthomyces muscarius]KAJ4144761.1 hypothetical protein LMH87_003632 [Akanthomyces muscarius]